MKGLKVAALVGLCVLVLFLVGSMVMGMRGERPPELAGVEVELPERRVRVEVLNAAGIPRLAQRETDRLRDEGFDVVFFGNARGFHPDTSLVLDRVGDPAAARAVAAVLGINQVREAPDTSLYLEVTVILGRDWAEANAESVAN
ncbi:MAG TPA: LytR C-terminal domain-containing protein [Longimicrobiaceae bacterium]